LFYTHISSTATYSTMVFFSSHAAKISLQNILPPRLGSGEISSW